MTETPEQIAARYGAVCRPRLQVTVCPPATFSEDSWGPMRIKAAGNLAVRLRSLGARLRAADERARPEPEPVLQMVMVSGPTKPPKPAAKPNARIAKPVTPKPPADPHAKYRARWATRDAHRDEVTRLHAQGMSDSEIGKAIGKPASVVCDWRGRFGLPGHKFDMPHIRKFKALVEARGEEVRRLHAQGLSDVKISEAMGDVKRTQVSRIRYALGLDAQPRKSKERAK